jgi:N-acyl-D-amino-acid deacylase
MEVMMQGRSSRRAGTVLIRGGVVVDGTGGKARRADIRIADGVIAAIGDAGREPADMVIDAGGKVVAPGFIDTHSHADGGLLDAPEAESQIRQGITTALVGQDGGSNYPLMEWFQNVERTRVALNVASFVGHGMVRARVLGDDYRRPAASHEIRRMRALVAEEMKAGALGLSSGLEYNPGAYATIDEVIALAEVAGIYNGLYISHVRDEEEGALTSFQELVRIAEAARLPAQISHIKLASAPVWGKTGEVFRLMEDARRRGVDITADVYPYTYWQSSITVLMPPKADVRNDRTGWEKALAEIGGARNILLTGYEKEPSWTGKTLAEIAAAVRKEPVSVILELMAATDGRGATVVVTAMQEQDLKAFIAHPRIMFCSDGSLRSSHPRGAGTYPRILGRYVREERTISREEAIRKMTSFPARRMGLNDRGVLAPGRKADIVLFDPASVRDTATTKEPRAAPVGITDVLVNGVPVLRDGTITGARPGKALRRTAR